MNDDQIFEDRIVGASHTQSITKEDIKVWCDKHRSYIHDYGDLYGVQYVLDGQGWLWSLYLDSISEPHMFNFNVCDEQGRKIYDIEKL